MVRHGYHRLLVIVVATANGDKELVALEDGYRESEQSWRELLMDLKHRGLTVAPKIALGDGAMGLWKALKKVYPLNPPSLLSN